MKQKSKVILYFSKEIPVVKTNVGSYIQNFNKFEIKNKMWKINI